MNFKQALQMLIDGHAIIRKRDYDNYDEQFLLLNENGWINYMNEPLTLSAKELLDWAESEDWCSVNLEREITHT